MKAMWDPFRDMDDFLSSFNRAAGKAALPQGTGKDGNLVTRDWTPAVDISETDEEYLIKAELPEVRKEDIRISVDGGVLTVEGERKVEKEEKNKKYHRVERFYGSFTRSFGLPEDADESGIRAEHADGVLKIHLAKTPQAKPEKVEVKVE